MTSIVRLRKLSGYDDPNLAEFVRSAIDADLPDLKGKRILLKPNMLLGVNRHLASTTHPALVAAVIDACRDKGARVFVGDSPGIPLSGIAVGRQLGLYDVALKHGAEFVDFSRNPVERRRKENKLVKVFTVAGILDSVDHVINLPKLKTHLSAIYTGAVKNLFGLVPGLLKAQFHVKFPERARFGQMLADLASIVRPSLSIMDAVIAMEGEGPSNGSPVPMGLVLASRDMVALDTVACSLIGLRPDQVPSVHCAAADGLGVSDLGAIRLEGVRDLASVAPKKFLLRQSNKEMRFGPAGPFQRWMKRAAIARPVIRSSDCVTCGQCVKICPAIALSMEKDTVPVFDYDKCIRCYCCHEICPEGAIHKRETILSRILG